MRIGDADRRRRLPRSERGDAGRRAARASASYDDEVVGLPRRLAWRHGRRHVALDVERLRGIASSRRHDPRHVPRPARSRSTAASTGCADSSSSMGIDALIAIGGEGTSAWPTSSTTLGIPVVGRAEDDRQRHRAPPR